MRVGYKLFKPLHAHPPSCYPSIGILTLNPSFQTLWKGDILIKCNLFLTWHLLYLLSRQTNIKVTSKLRLDRPPRPIQARMQWCYLHLLPRSRSLKYRHPLPKDAYFLVQERVVRSAGLVLRGISYILSSGREAYHLLVGTLSSTHILIISGDCLTCRIIASLLDFCILYILKHIMPAVRNYFICSELRVELLWPRFQGQA